MGIGVRSWDKGKRGGPTTSHACPGIDLAIPATGGLYRRPRQGCALADTRRWTWCMRAGEQQQNARVGSTRAFCCCSAIERSSLIHVGRSGRAHILPSCRHMHDACCPTAMLCRAAHERCALAHTRGDVGHEPLGSIDRRRRGTWNRVCRSSLNRARTTERWVRIVPAVGGAGAKSWRSRSCAARCRSTSCARSNSRRRALWCGCMDMSVLLATVRWARVGPPSSLEGCRSSRSRLGDRRGVSWETEASRS